MVTFSSYSLQSRHNNVLETAGGQKQSKYCGCTAGNMDCMSLFPLFFPQPIANNVICIGTMQKL
jgi:hypothetical protein